MVRFGQDERVRDPAVLASFMWSRYPCAPDNSEQLSGRWAEHFNTLEDRFFLPFIRFVNGATPEDLRRSESAISVFVGRFIGEFLSLLEGLASEDQDYDEVLRNRCGARGVSLPDEFADAVSRLSEEAGDAVRFTVSDMNQAIGVLHRLGDGDALDEASYARNLIEFVGGVSSWIFGIGTLVAALGRRLEVSQELAGLLAHMLRAGSESAFAAVRSIELQREAEPELDPAGRPADVLDDEQRQLEEEAFLTAPSVE